MTRLKVKIRWEKVEDRCYALYISYLIPGINRSIHWKEFLDGMLKTNFQQRHHCLKLRYNDCWNCCFCSTLALKHKPYSEKSTSVISKIKTELAGIPVRATLPYPRRDGMIKVILPPFLTSGMPICQPSIKF